MPTRRDVLQLAAGVLTLGSAACRGPASRLPPGAVAIPLADLPEGVHVERLRGTEPIDIVREGTSIVVRSRFCPHMGCVVAWNVERKGYACPCHGGAFDADGRPSAGPPTMPLRQLPIQIDGADLIVLPRATKRDA